MIDYEALALRAMTLAYRTRNPLRALRAYNLAVKFITRRVADRAVKEMLYSESARNIRGYGKSIMQTFLAETNAVAAMRPTMVIVDENLPDIALLRKAQQQIAEAVFEHDTLRDLRPTRHYTDLNTDWRNKKGKHR